MTAGDKPVALITGGTGGIGQEIAIQLIQEGLEVVLAARHQDAALHPTLQGQCQTLVMDVSDPVQVEQGFAALHQQYHRLDLLVNAAGGTHFKPIQRMKVADWDHAMTIHARGCFLCSQQAIKLMKRHKTGLIIHIASLAAKQPKPGFAAYGAAKAAVANLSHGLNAEVGRLGIRSMVINPSYVDTPLLGDHNYPPEQMIPPQVIANFVRAMWQMPRHVTLPELTLNTVEC